ncbi:hypothetical protein SLS62_001213 [Diatrype stigma]|uniref:Uncharacterized protein n=1 Tax=Diatrype stigma TaxID=117547 RepID=A0AAN9YWV7_9PEZI
MKSVITAIIATFAVIVVADLVSSGAEHHEISAQDPTRTGTGTGIAMPAHYVPLDPSNLRADADVAVVATAADAAALSARYGHRVRVDAVAGQLVYVHVPPAAEGGGPAVHIGTLRGEELGRALELIYYHRHHHPPGPAAAQSVGFGPGEGHNSSLGGGGTIAAAGEDGHVDAPMGCLSHLCLSSWQCMRIRGGGCGACMIFWCT